jgi:uncharacterized membrane protein
MTPNTLRHVPLFESLDDESAQKLCELLETRECKAQHTLFRAGEPGDAMYLVESGKVRISVQATDGHELMLAELGRGEFFGEMALLDGQARSANATAVEDSQLAVLSREHLFSFIRTTPNVSLEMLTALAHRLRRTDEILRHRATRNVNEEMAAQLTLGDRAADVIAEFGGSWKFIGVFFGLFLLWMGINTWAASRILFGSQPFDATPYVLLNLVLNIITALQAPIIMMSQNRQSHKDRLRADLDYQVNLKNELALNEILQRLKILEQDCLRFAGEKGRDANSALDGV